MLLCKKTKGSTGLLALSIRFLPHKTNLVKQFSQKRPRFSGARTLAKGSSLTIDAPVGIFSLATI